MKIAYIALSAIPCREANSIHVMKMCQAYARLGHQVTLAVPRATKMAETGVLDIHDFYGVENNFRVLRIPLWNSLPGALAYGFLLPLAAISVVRPDLVHCRSLSPAWTSACLLRRPTLYETHTPISDNPRQRKLFRRLVHSRKLSSLAVITHALAEEIQPQLPAHTPLVIAPDGVDRTYLDVHFSRMEARRRLGLPLDDRRCVVYAGHLYPGRGVELMLELARRLPDHRFLLVGGSEEDLVRHRARADRPPNACFVGFRPPSQIPIWLRAADALLMPYGTRVEVARGGGDTSRFMSPMKMFEYMAAGRPILASALPVVQEIVEDQVHALLCEPENPGAWEQSLRRLRADQGLARRLGQQARRDVRAYTWERRAQRLLESIRENQQ